MMEIHFAPLQGFTEAPYRKAHFLHCCGGASSTDSTDFPGIAAYYTPFLRVEKGEVRAKDLRDLQQDLEFIKSLPAHSLSCHPPLDLCCHPPLDGGSSGFYRVIPQIICKDVNEFNILVNAIMTLNQEATQLGIKGFDQIDINMGCPFPMQAKAGRGSGLLPKVDTIKEILQEVKRLTNAGQQTTPRQSEQRHTELVYFDHLVLQHLRGHDPREGTASAVYTADADLRQYDNQGFAATVCSADADLRQHDCLSTAAQQSHTEQTAQCHPELVSGSAVYTADADLRQHDNQGFAATVCSADADLRQHDCLSTAAQQSHTEQTAQCHPELVSGSAVYTADADLRQHDCLSTAAQQSHTEQTAQCHPELVSGSAVYTADADLRQHDNQGFAATVCSADADLRQYDSISQHDLKFSIKMRLGYSAPTECLALLPLLNEAPLAHITMHPRLGVQQYKGALDFDSFRQFYEGCRHPLVFNGDITSFKQIENIQQMFPALKGVMVGRGLLANPTLSPQYPLEKLLRIHASLLDDYRRRLQGDAQILDKIRPFWTYPMEAAQNDSAIADALPKRILKKISKARNLGEYEEAIAQIANP